MGSGASVQSLPTTHVKAAAEADVPDVACIVSSLSTAERQKLQQALSILETEASCEANREPKTSPYPSLLGATRPPQLAEMSMTSKGSKGGYGEHLSAMNQ